MDNNEYILNLDDITNIVDALEVYISYERNKSISEDRDFNRGIHSTYLYMRAFENFLKRSEAKYVKLSHSI